MLTVLCRCACLPDEFHVEVRDRGEKEDIIHWMRTVVQLRIGEVHSNLSPKCRRTELTYAKVPLPNEEKGIGYGA